jgi:tetratricopeptide (TPR) repeat protein
LLALLFANHLVAEDARVTAFVQQADADDARRDAKAALVALEQAEALDPNNFGVILRISKQYADLVDSSGADKPAAKNYAEKALAYARRAAVLDDKSAKAHLNLAICYGKLTDHVGSKVKMEYAKLIRDEAQRSIDLDPTDDYAWHVLGRWHAGVANLNGVLKTLASFVYGGLPSASFEDAVKCLKKAAELAPQRLMHRAELAKVYGLMGRPELAAQEWQNVLGIRAMDGQDEEYQRDARIALEKSRPGRAPRGRGMAGR